MNTTTESEKNASAPEVPHPKKQAPGREESQACEEASQLTESGPRQQEGRGHRDDEASQGRDARRDNGRHQAHTVRGFVSIFGSKGGRRSSRPRTPRASGSTRLRSSNSQATVRPNAASGHQPGAPACDGLHASGSPQ
jgi:hypothetical protein